MLYRLGIRYISGEFTIVKWQSRLFAEDQEEVDLRKFIIFLVLAPLNLIQGLGIKDSYSYTAYGELISHKGSSDNPYLYCGESYDEGSGLYYLRARYMNPDTGSFISMDSYQGNAYDPASLHKYTYAQNNPMMYEDPSGHFISMVEAAVSSSIQTIIDNSYHLHVLGMLGGMTRVLTNHILGGDEDDATAFIKGYIMGFGLGAVYLCVTTVAVLSALQFWMHTFFAGMMNYQTMASVTASIVYASTGQNVKAGYCAVMGVLAFIGYAHELNMSIDVLVQGPKGSVMISYDNSEAAAEPVNELGEGGSGKKTLYHYTNEKGLKGITESNQLNPSLKANNPKDARYGNGQYLSDINPESTTPAKLARKFINVPNKYKYTHYIEIDVTDLNVIQGRDGVYVIPNEEALDLTGRIKNSGKVGD